MSGAERRAFQADMALKYCAGSSRRVETVFGWGRQSVQQGLHELRTGIVCLDARATFSGDKLWEEKHPQVADALWVLAQVHSQQDPTFRTTLSFTRLTAKEALAQLRAQGLAEEQLPSPSTMAEVLNRNGYRLRPVVKAKPQKSSGNRRHLRQHQAKGPILRRQGKAGHAIEHGLQGHVNIGEYARGGKTRGDNRALDHDIGCKEKYVPFGIVDEDSGQLHLIFGGSAKTSDFIVDGLYAWWEHQSEAVRSDCALLQIKADNGPESNDRRTRFLKLMVEFADHIGKPIQLLYYPPYHSKYNPVERCWGILEQHWNDAKLLDATTMLEWTESMTWKGIHHIV